MSTKETNKINIKAKFMKVTEEEFYLLRQWVEVVAEEQINSILGRDNTWSYPRQSEIEDKAYMLFVENS